MAGRTAKTFRNERLTYRLDILAGEAISANDGVFVRETGCTIREIRVLRLVDDTPGITFREITAATGLERSLVSRIIQKLLAQALIERTNAADDARKFHLSTTEAGKEKRRVARALSDRLEAVLLEPLGPEEQRLLNDHIDRLARWVRSPAYRERIAADQGGGAPGSGAPGGEG